MAEHGHGHGSEHETVEHKHGEMDIAEHRWMFERFIKFWVLLFGVSAGILIFLALFNS